MYAIRSYYAGDFHAPAFTARQADAGLVAQVSDMQFLHQGLQQLAALLPVQSLADLQHRQDIFGYRHFPEDRRLLGKVV